MNMNDSKQQSLLHDRAWIAAVPAEPEISVIRFLTLLHSENKTRAKSLHHTNKSVTLLGTAVLRAKC